jgi:hypothetical protein
LRPRYRIESVITWLPPGWADKIAGQVPINSASYCRPMSLT